jgi:DNA-binding transcriptional LysR family regulator
MELRHLRYFVAVAEHLHFGRAANELRTAQPSLSQQIRKLEDELGVRLLERDRHTVRLTPAGIAFLGEARALIARSERSVLLARAAASGNLGHLRVAFSFLAMGPLLRTGIRGFSMSHPSVTLSIRIGGDRALIDELLAERIDVALAQSLPPGEAAALGLRQAPHGTYHVTCALGAGHRLAERAEVRVDDLRGERLLTYERRLNPELYARVLELCGAAGYDPPSIQEVADEAALLVLCSAGLGVALVPASWNVLCVAGTRFCPIAPSAPELGISVYWRTDTGNASLPAFVEQVVSTL